MIIKLLAIYFYLRQIESQLKTSKEKYRILLDKTMQTKDGLIYMNDDQAKIYLTDHPRSYDVAVIFITQKCEFCWELVTFFSKVSAAYK